MEGTRTLAQSLERAWILNLIFAISGLAFIAWSWYRTGFALDINSLILIFFCLGLLLHWTPISYVGAVNEAARITGPLIIQYPIYGGIMGIMTATGLAGVIATVVRCVCERCDASVLELCRFDHHQPVCSERRRSLGGSRTVCGSRGGPAACVTSRYGDGRCHR